jgi:hypothetical protein
MNHEFGINDDMFNDNNLYDDMMEEKKYKK